LCATLFFFLFFFSHQQNSELVPQIGAQTIPLRSSPIHQSLITLHLYGPSYSIKETLNK